MRLPKIREKLAGFSLRGPVGVVSLVAIVVIAFVLGGWLFSGGGPQAPTSSDSATQVHADEDGGVWTCSMHPQIRMPKAGKCPICFMDLIPASSGMRDDEGPRQLRMTETAKQLARIQTSQARRGFAEAEIRMVGKIAYDETRLAYITAWVPGRLDRLYADYTGVVVKQGDHMVSMYSPELLAAQEELIQALATTRALKATSSRVLRSTSESTVNAAREKLRLYGLTVAQIERIEATGETTDHLTVYAPTGGVVVHKDATEGMYVETGTRIYTIADLGNLWLVLEAYESDLAWLRYGQRIEFTSRSFPGEQFDATISFIDPLVNPKTRTVRVRAVVDNRDRRLKPDMFVRGIVHSGLAAGGRVLDKNLASKWISPMHPEVIKDGPGQCDVCGMDLVPIASLGYTPAAQGDEEAPLLIPVTAPLITGKRAVVYIELPSDDGPLFEGREVELGPRAGSFYIVKSGIEEGEFVVTNGAFKLDSELQIRAKPSMMSPEGGVKGPSHDHGEHESHSATASGGAGPVSQAGPRESGEALAALSPVYHAYFELQRALAGDDLDSARRSGTKLTAAAATFDMALLSTGGHERWMKLSNDIRKRADALGESGDIESARDEFHFLSQAVIGLERALGHAGADTHYVAFCPMARSGDGAYWLQTDDTISNAYYGDRMLRCGSVEETFPPLSATGSE